MKARKENVINLSVVTEDKKQTEVCGFIKTRNYSGCFYILQVYCFHFAFKHFI